MRKFSLRNQMGAYTVLVVVVYIFDVLVQQNQWAVEQCQPDCKVGGPAIAVESVLVIGVLLLLLVVVLNLMVVGPRHTPREFDEGGGG